MNTYTIESLNRAFAVVKYTINAKTFTEKYDARHLPVDDADELDMYFQKQMAGYITDATVVELPVETSSLVGVKRNHDAEKVAKRIAEEEAAKKAAEEAKAKAK